MCKPYDFGIDMLWLQVHLEYVDILIIQTLLNHLHLPIINTCTLNSKYICTILYLFLCEGKCKSPTQGKVVMLHVGQCDSG